MDRQMSRFDPYLKLASYLVAFGGLSSLAFTSQMPIPLLSFALLSFLFSFFKERFGFTVKASSKIWDGLALAVFALYISELFMTLSFFIATIHLLIFLQILKLLTLEEDKDYLYLYLLSFCELLAASVLNLNLSYLLSFLLFLVAITWALLLRHLKKGMGEESFCFNSSFFLIVSGISMLAFAITLALFFMIPHVELGFSRKEISRPIHLSGFSEDVYLGGLGQVKLDSTVVMRVKVWGRGKHILYWRGTAFDYFDGFSWHKTYIRKRVLLKNADGSFSVSRIGGNRKLIRQEFFLEPIDSSVIFTAPKTVLVEGNFPYLLKDSANALYLPHPSGVPVSYTVYSVAEDSYRSHLKPAQEKIYLSMPAMAESIKKMSERITKGLSNPYEKILALQEFLKSNYKYDLHVRRDHRFSPMDDFLFNRKTGYCEHFATAMVLMLRSVGIPARLVTGFLQGQWNDFGKYYLIRQKDAHSWVEAYLPSEGWITVDPTPPAQYEHSTPPFFYRYVDFLRLKWHRYILCYSLEDQINLIHGLGVQIHRLGTYLINSSLWIKEFLQHSVNRLMRMDGILWNEFSAISLILASVLAGFLIALRTLKAGQVHPNFRPSLRRHQPVKRVRFYEKMLKILQKKGLVRAAWVTPLEFAQQIIKMKGENFYEIMEITFIYNKVRFGDKVLSAEEEERVWDVIKHLKKKLDGRG